MILPIVATRHLFFTGKGGVGKTSLACATAIELAEAGRRVLLVSTDPASNLDEMLGVQLGPTPTAVPGVERLFALDIDPQEAADAYRSRALAALRGTLTDQEIEAVREQLSGACTTEIASFDRFAGLLAGDALAERFDHVIFDTAPTGHTLRLLELPRAWTEFLGKSTHGASCLGPHAALTTQRDRFAAAMAALGDASRTTVALVARPDRPSLREAARSSAELRAVGVGSQVLLVNAEFHATDRDDAVARALERHGQEALAAMPAELAALPQRRIPLLADDMVGLTALRRLIAREGPAVSPVSGAPAPPSLPRLEELVDAIALGGRGLVMVMGKGGVGKTTIACAIAVALAERGHDVHLSTTDPAAHVEATVGAAPLHLSVGRIDPRVETAAYTARMLERRGAGLDADGLALLEEDLRSPCTEEVAVFHAFVRVVAQARKSFVILDTAPTGHTLLLLDAAGAYHREVVRGLTGNDAARLITPLMRMQDPAYTKVILTTLAETTPVSEAAQLQEDLRRAGVEPFAWVINASLAAAGVHDPLLRARVAQELRQIERVRGGLARRVAVVPWASEPPVGADRLAALVR
jgi:arsenite-transporting ATPase